MSRRLTHDDQRQAPNLGVDRARAQRDVGRARSPAGRRSLRPAAPGWALIGPGGWISFAVEPCVDDFPDLEGELSPLAVLDNPEVHPANTRHAATRVAPMRKQRDMRCLQSPSWPVLCRFTIHRPAWIGGLLPRGRGACRLGCPASLPLDVSGCRGTSGTYRDSTKCESKGQNDAPKPSAVSAASGARPSAPARRVRGAGW